MKHLTDGLGTYVQHIPTAVQLGKVLKLYSLAPDFGVTTAVPRYPRHEASNSTSRVLDLFIDFSESVNKKS